LGIVDVLVAELANKMREFAFPSYEAFERIEAFIIRLWRTVNERELPRRA
jgi:hypothetical protein